MDEAEKLNFCPTSLKAQAADWSENSSSGWGVGVGMLNVWFWCFFKVAYSSPAQTGICQSDQNYYIGTITDSQHFQPSDSVVGERTCRTKSWESSHTKNPTSVSRKSIKSRFLRHVLISDTKYTLCKNNSRLVLDDNPHRTEHLTGEMRQFLGVVVLGRMVILIWEHQNLKEFRAGFFACSTSCYTFACLKTVSAHSQFLGSLGQGSHHTLVHVSFLGTHFACMLY